MSWTKPEKRREFFEKYAEANLFNPYVPENWYLQPRDKILAVKVSSIFVFSLHPFLVSPFSFISLLSIFS
jgi:hypothetical protein